MRSLLNKAFWRVYTKMFGKKRIERLAQKMIHGVDVAKLVLYKILVDELSKKYEEKGERFYKGLAASIINEIFGCHNYTSRAMFLENREIIEDEIRNLGENYPGLKQPITDSLRVFVQANHMLGSKVMEDHDFVTALFTKAIERGVLVKGGEAPNPQSFFAMIEKLGKEYKVIEKGI